MRCRPGILNIDGYRLHEYTRYNAYMNKKNFLNVLRVKVRYFLFNSLHRYICIYLTFKFLNTIKVCMTTYMHDKNPDYVF